MCFSILLVKLMIILSSKSVGYLKGIFQILMFIFAWGVQIVVDVEWLILRPAEVVMVSEKLLFFSKASGVRVTHKSRPRNPRKSLIVSDLPCQ